MVVVVVVVVAAAAARQADNSNAEPVAQYGRALVDAHLGGVGAARAAAERGSALAAAGQAAANGGAGRRSAKARAVSLDRAIAYASSISSRRSRQQPL